MIRVAFDVSPLKNENAHRGVGAYTRFLTEELKKLPDIEVVDLKSKNAKMNISVVHYPYFDLFFPTLPLKLIHTSVVTIHDVIPLVLHDHYKVGKKGKLNFIRQLIALRSMNAIVTDSEASKKDIVKYLKVAEEKVHVIYLAPNPKLKSVSSEKSKEVKEKYHIDSKYVLYVGDINYNKNIPQLIKMVKFLPEEITLVCVGKNFYPHNIPEWEAIELQVALSNVEKRVIFITDLGANSENDLSALYSGAAAYVQPSLYEGFGLPITEAMQCETPVVSAKNSSLIEVGGDAVYFVEPTAEALADGVKAILNFAPFERSEMIKKAKKWVSQFSWTRTAHETAILYRQLIDRNS